MFTTAQIPWLLLLVHLYLVIRFCVGSMFRPAGRPYSFQRLLLIALVPFIGYYFYYRKYIVQKGIDTLHE